MRTKEKGITLLALILTIVLLIILTSIGAIAGSTTIQTARFTRFRTELKMMQDKVNELNQNGGQQLGTELTDKQKAVLDITEISNIIYKGIAAENREQVKNGFRYFSKDYINTELDLDSVEREYLINVEYRYIVFPDGFEYEGTTYYMIDQIEGEIYNVQYNDKNEKTGSFDVSATKQDDRWKIEVSNIVHTGYVDKWQVKYKLEDSEIWRTSDDLAFYVDDVGVYDIKVVHGEEIDLGQEQISLFEKLVDVVSIGDYVAYDATNNYDYTSYTGTGTTGGNGYRTVASQTFTSSSSIKWRVLSADTETGEVVLISEAPIRKFWYVWCNRIFICRRRTK